MFDASKGYGPKFQYKDVLFKPLTHVWVKLQVHNYIKVVFEVSNHREYDKNLV